MKFVVNDLVVISLTSQKGKVIGRAEYDSVFPNSYWVQYVSGEGNLTKAWFDEHDISAA